VSDGEHDEVSQPHARRVRYRGKNPRRFAEKYKEHAAERYPGTIAKVRAAGKTPAGSHIPVLVSEILEVLSPAPGETAVDCTLGYGGHAREILRRILPGGRMLALDADPLELERSNRRLRAEGFGVDVLQFERMNFAGVVRAMAANGIQGADCLLADLGVSSMQLDNPSRGFSVKFDGPLDMRMNPEKGVSASDLLARLTAGKLQQLLEENSDEPRARQLALALAGKRLDSTLSLVAAIRQALPGVSQLEGDLAVRRVFQALRIAVNEEFSALDMLLRQLPECLRPGGRVAVLTFHSGEDRRVKKAFQAGLRTGLYAAVSRDVIRPSPKECRENPRSTSAKLRWALRAA